MTQSKYPLLHKELLVVQDFCFWTKKVWSRLRATFEGSFFHVFGGKIFFFNFFENTIASALKSCIEKRYFFHVFVLFYKLKFECNLSVSTWRTGTSICSLICGGGAGRGIFFRWLTYILKSKCDLQTFARFVFKFNNTKKKSIYYRWAYLVLLTGASNLLKTLKRLKSFIVLKT